MPSPQLSQRRTGAPRRSSSASQPKSGSPQAGQGGLSGPAPASSGTRRARVVNSSMRCSVRIRARGHPDLKRRKEDVLAWESRWSLPTGLLTFAGRRHPDRLGDRASPASTARRSRTARLGARTLLFGDDLLGPRGDRLPDPDWRRSTSSSAPRSRGPSGKMRSQLVGVIIVAPIFFAISGVLNGDRHQRSGRHLPQGRSEVDAERRKGRRRMLVNEEREKGAKAFGEKYDSRRDAAQRLRSRTNRKKARREERAERSQRCAPRRPASGWRAGSASPSRWSTAACGRCGSVC